jgi:hypothetical protein
MEPDVDVFVSSYNPGINIGASELIKARRIVTSLNSDLQQLRRASQNELASYKARLRERYKSYVIHRGVKQSEQGLQLIELLERRAKNTVSSLLELALKELFEQYPESIYESLLGRALAQGLLLGLDMVLEVRCAPGLCRLIASKVSGIKTEADENMGRYEIVIVTGSGSCAFNLEENLESFLQSCRILLLNGDLSP